MEKKFESTSQSLDSLSEMVHKLSIGFSEGQIKTLTSMINSLQSQILIKDSKDSCFTQKADCDARSAEDGGRKDGRAAVGHQLKSSLGRLAQIANDARTIAPSHEARSVLEALETIIDLMIDRPSLPDSQNLKRKRADDFHSMKNETEYGQDPKRIRGLLTTSQSIILNPKGNIVTDET